jgi:hypothetical protein
MILYALTIVVSAFLLFQVQPVIAKIILPWFGGSAAVWTTCLLFFQMVLLLGYLYSHAVIRYLKPRAQMLLHAGLLLASVVVLPIYPNVSWKPVGVAEPTLQILGLLAVTVGLPYFLLSTTGPLLQAWYARRFQGAMPYRLYALSNAGSMFALLSYPVLFEPAFNTHQQSGMWSWGFGVFVVLCAVTAFLSNRSRAGTGDGDPGPRPGTDRTASEFAANGAGNSWQSGQSPGQDVLDVAAAARGGFGAAVGHHQSPFAERGGHSLSLGASAEYLPAQFHPLLRRRRLVPAEPVPPTARRGPGQHGLRGQYRFRQQRAHQDHGSLILHGAVHLLHGVPR